MFSDIESRTKSRENKSYPTNLVADEQLHLIARKKDMKYSRIGVTIHGIKVETTALVSTVTLIKTTPLPTLLLPIGMDDKLMVCGFKMYHLFKEYTLKENKNCQQFQARNTMFKCYLNLSIHTKLRLYIVLIQKKHLTSEKKLPIII